MTMIQRCFIAILCLGVQRSSPKILERQKRDWIIDSLEIDEGYNGIYPYSLGFIKLADDVRAFNLHGQGVELDPKDLLSIDEDTGEITVHYAVDYEQYPVLKLAFEAVIKETRRVDMRLGVEVRIKDANDNAPTFKPQQVQVSILESTKQGTNIVTLVVMDKDTENENNNKFDMKIISVTPKTQDMEFYLEQRGELGMISFKGCLDHTMAEKYTIIVEAKDRGETTQLSSSGTVTVTIEDGNNYRPEFLGTTTKGSVKETLDSVLVCRVQADDKDTRGSAAWKVKYIIHGDTDNNFDIETDPETNDGLLYVKKPLDYEGSPLVNLTLTLDNEIPYYLCKVIKRTGTKLWQVSEEKAGATVQGSSSSQRMSVTVSVEDVNEAPVFDERIKRAKVAENGGMGINLARFTATDPDVMQSNSFVFMKGEDPAGWITVDQKTGEVKTAKALDRESHYVKDGIYNVTVLVVDTGTPSMTGTATLTIYVSDENDNSPTLEVDTIEMCQLDGASVANISVTDLDGEPYGGPFSFRVLGDVEGKWRVHPKQGHFVNLVKENTVFSGVYDILLEVADRQHITSVHNLSVTVCSCHDPTIPNCRQRSTSGSTAGATSIGIILAGLILLAAALCTVLLTCKKKIVQFPEETFGNLIKSNSESMGTDCKVTLGRLVQKSSENGGTLQTINRNQAVKKKNHMSSFMSDNVAKWKSENRLIGSSSTLKTRHQEGQHLLGLHQFSANETFGASSALSVERQNEYLQNTLYLNWMREKTYSAECQASTMKAYQKFIIQILSKKLHSLQAAGEELGDYDPKVYADEELEETLCELDTIPLPDISFDSNVALDDRFYNLALIGMNHQNAKTTLVQKPDEVVLERTTTFNTAAEGGKVHGEKPTGWYSDRDEIIVP